MIFVDFSLFFILFKTKRWIIKIKLNLTKIVQLINDDTWHHVLTIMKYFSFFFVCSFSFFYEWEKRDCTKSLNNSSIIIYNFLTLVNFTPSFQVRNYN